MKTTKSKRVIAIVAETAPPKRQLWPYVAALGFLVFLVFEVYGPAMNGPFLLDDTYLPYLRPGFENLPLRAWLTGVRPVVMLTFWFNYRLFGNQNTFSYHFVNIVIHLLNGLLCYLAVRKILSWTTADRPVAQMLSIFAGGLFLLHPVQTEAVSYVAERSDTLSVFFVLAAFVVFLYRKSQAASVRVAVVILILFAAAVLTKEHAIALAGLFILTDYFWNPGFSLDGIRRNWKLYVPMAAAAVLGLAFVWRVLSTATTAGFAMKDFTWYQYFFTQCRAIWVYLRMFLLPYGQNIDYDYPISRTILDRGAIFGLIGLIALTAFAWYYRQRFRLISYGVFTFLVLLAPTSSFVPIQDPLLERRLYLPFIGLLFITTGLLQLWKPKQSTLVAALSLILLVTAALAYQRNELWGNAILIWKDSVAASPKKVRPSFQLAYAYYQADRCNDAVDEYSKTAQLEKPTYDLLMDWGLAYDCAGNSSDAIAKWNEAAHLEPSAHAYSQIGMEYAKQAKYPEALDVLDKAATLDPNFEMTYIYRGNIYTLQGNVDRAAEEYHHALAINPNNQLARDGLQRIGR